MTHPYPHLFQPLKIGPRVSPNRVMRVSTATNSGRNGGVSDLTIAIHRRLARGGTGVIVTESMRVHPSNAGRASTFFLYKPEIIPSMAKLADAVHAEGSLLIAQMNHGGRQHHSEDHPMLWAPSAIACPHSGGIPHAMSKAEIREIVDGFAKAAANARAAGCAGVEIHGAQGHLIQEFLSPQSNQRTDEYGGSRANRVRFAVEIVQAVRDKLGPDFILGYRLGVEEFWPGALTIEDSLEAAQRLNELGAVNYFSLAQGNFNTLDYHLPDAHFPAPSFMEIQSRFKPLLNGTPVAASARINTPEQAEAIIASGQADMAGLCRALIADPEWPIKAREGRRDDIQECIACNRCWTWVTESKPLRCAINPGVGVELDEPVKPARSKRVVVIGGGPAGMEAARGLAEAGHAVTLFERRKVLGGKLDYTRHHLPYHEASYAIDWQERQLKKLKVDVRMGIDATVDNVTALKPDAVVVASGATITKPAAPGDGSVPVSVYSGRKEGALVVLMDEDGNYWAACVAEAMARHGCKLIYVTRFMQPLREMPEVSRISTLRALDKLGVQIRVNMYIDRCAQGEVWLRHYYNTDRTENLGKVDEIVWAGAQQCNGGIADALRGAGVKEVHVIGDAVSPRRLPDATHEAYRAARAISATR